MVVTKKTQIYDSKLHEDTYVAYIPTLAVLPYKTMIHYYPKLKFNYFHHCWETWHHLTSSQFPPGLSAGPVFKDMDTSCASETKIRQADGIHWFFRPWSTNLLVSVGQTKRQRINYFYVNEAISMSEHRQSAYLLVPIGDGIFYSVWCIVHILHFIPT